MSSFLIKNGRVIDPANGIDAVLDLLIDSQTISKMGPQLTAPHSQTQILDATGFVVAPGLIDLHVHLREPGQEHKEDIHTGTRAAAAGGFTSVCCMANTDPVNDHPVVTRAILYSAEKTGVVNVFPIGAVTKNLEGKELAAIAGLKQAGCVALSDDGKTVQNSALMRAGLECAKEFDLAVSTHCLCHDLMGQGVMSAGKMADSLGLIGIPHEAEEIIIARDIALSQLTGARVHIAHVSTARGVELVRQAKARGVLVSAEVTPHHFTLTDAACRGYDSSTKMAPPLRTEEDVAALWKGLQDGTIDAIATDHAPHSIAEKEVGFEKAPFGMIGLETALPLSLALVEKEVIGLSQMIALLTNRPSRVFGLNRGTLSVGAPADIVVFDPEEKWTYNVDKGYSKSQNSPFHRSKLKGKVQWTFVGGRRVYPFQEV